MQSCLDMQPKAYAVGALRRLTLRLENTALYRHYGQLLDSRFAPDLSSLSRLFPPRVRRQLRLCQSLRGRARRRIRHGQDGVSLLVPGASWQPALNRKQQRRAVKLIELTFECATTRGPSL